MSLQYLDFDYSEDAHGHGSFEAMASVPESRLPALHAEIAQVLDWAFAAFPGQRAPMEEGGEWDYLLHGQQEWTAPESLIYDEVARRFSRQLGTTGAPRHMLTISISGSAQFCEAFRRGFAVG
ncbi:MAG: hypothetical protein Q8R72_15685 [Hylemonella sp.]|nr:hypothetical protein [Hylemonella sp.]